jgi:hypothetical protein
MRKFTLPSFKFGRQNKPGSLARTIIQTLLVFTLIPLTLMAGAAYFRTRQLLQDQVVTQTQNLVTTQMDAAQNTMKIKQVRLDRFARQPDFVSAMQIVQHEERTNPDFVEARNQIAVIFGEINRETASPIFNLFMIIDEQGVVLVSSERKWESQSLAGTQIFAALSESDNQSFGVYDFSPFFPAEFSLLTVKQYDAPDGISHAMILGVSEQQTAEALLQPNALLAGLLCHQFWRIHRTGFLYRGTQTICVVG